MINNRSFYPLFLLLCVASLGYACSPDPDPPGKFWSRMFPGVEIVHYNNCFLETKILLYKKFILIAGGDATSTISPTAKEGNGKEPLTTKGPRTGRLFMQLFVLSVMTFKTQLYYFY